MKTRHLDSVVQKIRDHVGWWRCDLDFDGRSVHITLPILSDWPITPDDNIRADAKTLFGQTPVVVKSESRKHLGVIESAISAIAILSDLQRRGEIYSDLTSIDELELQIDFYDIIHRWKYHVPLDNVEHWTEVRELVDLWLRLDRFSIFK